MSGAALAEAAEALAGTRFRLHGREPATGLDCVGLLAASLRAIGRSGAVPTGYSLRARRLPDLTRWAELSGLVRASGTTFPGDVLLVRIGACHFHLAIVLGCERVVHAHAGRKRVLVEPIPPGWQVQSRWRL